MKKTFLMPFFVVLLSVAAFAVLNDPDGYDKINYFSLLTASGTSGYVSGGVAHCGAYSRDTNANGWGSAGSCFNWMTAKGCDGSKSCTGSTAAGSSNPSYTAQPTACSGGDVRCSGNTRQYCQSSSHSWISSGDCPSGTSCVQESSSRITCVGTTNAECINGFQYCTYFGNLAGAIIYDCVNGKKVQSSKCSAGQYCKSTQGSNTYTCVSSSSSDKCSSSSDCPSNNICVASPAGRYCLSCAADGNCNAPCPKDPDCAASNAALENSPGFQAEKQAYLDALNKLLEGKGYAESTPTGVKTTIASPLEDKASCENSGGVWVEESCNVWCKIGITKPKMTCQKIDYTKYFLIGLGVVMVYLIFFRRKR